MKRATLLGMIGVAMILLIQVYWTVFQFAELDYDVTVAKISNLIDVTGWLLIAVFFVELYKKQRG